MGNCETLKSMKTREGEVAIYSVMKQEVNSMTYDFTALSANYLDIRITKRKQYFIVCHMIKSYKRYAENSQHF